MMSMVNEKGRPTEKQIAALRKFRVSEPEIQGMTFSQASARLDELIGQARARRQKGSVTPSRNVTSEGGLAGADSVGNLAPKFDEAYDIDQEMLESKAFVEQHFGENYMRGELVAEHARQKFAVFMAKAIQKNKQSNMERINKG
jgi:hypothetical protein